MSQPRRRRRLIPLLIVVAVLAALGWALYLRAKSPPEAARLLPESDAIVFLHLKTLRTLTHFDREPVHRSAYFQHFIDATGIVPERDLDSAAFALHRLPNARGPNGVVGYSEVFVGHFDGDRLDRYLSSISTARESYAGRTIFSVPSEGRTVRIARLEYDTVAASNMPTAEQIHSMLDRSRAPARSSAGSSLLAGRFREVPQLPLPPLVWGIGRIGLPFAANGHLSVLGLELPLPEDTDFVGSLRYQGSVQLRVEEIAPDALAAGHTVEVLTPLLSILRGLAAAQPPGAGADAAMRDALSSAKLEQRGSRALLTASISMEQLRALLHSGAPATTPSATSPETPDLAGPTQATPTVPSASK